MIGPTELRLGFSHSTRGTKNRLEGGNRFQATRDSSPSRLSLSELARTTSYDSSVSGSGCEAQRCTVTSLVCVGNKQERDLHTHSMYQLNVGHVRNDCMWCG